jgi:5'-deoxynucleotidase YfbR-like HD superfamily hydrolase
MRIYTNIFGVPTPETFVYMLLHDCGEIALGDIPYPTKSLNPVFKHEADTIEAAMLRSMLQAWEMVEWTPPPPAILMRVKIAELIEMAEEGLHEFELGSRFGFIVASRTLAAAARMAKGLEEKELRRRARQYVFTRLDLFSKRARLYEDTQALLINWRF